MTDAPTRRSGSGHLFWRSLGRGVATLGAACMAFALGAEPAGAATVAAPPKWAAYVATPSGACSGTIVGDGWVLTAAHCLYRDDGSSIPARSLTVSLGRKSIRAPGVAYRVDSRIAMPGYAAGKANDAALLHLVGFAAARWEALPLAHSGGDVHGAGALALGDRVHAFGDGDGCRLKGPMKTRYLCVRAGARFGPGDSGAGWLRRIDGAWRLVAVQGWTTGGQHPYALGTSTLAVTPDGRTLLRWVQTIAGLPTPAAGQIVHSAESGAAWLIDAFGGRIRIPDDSTYECLVSQGHAVFGAATGLRSIDVGTMPELVGATATCTTPPISAPPPPADAPTTCWDGSVVLAPQACPAEPATKRCWDGSYVTPSQLCPREIDKVCWDLSIYPIYVPCPPFAWMEMQTLLRAGKTYMDYHTPSGPGPEIAPGQWVSVSCRVFDPHITSANPEGWWYRILSPPFMNQYYSPASGFTSQEVQPRLPVEVDICPGRPSG